MKNGYKSTIPFLKKQEFIEKSSKQFDANSIKQMRNEIIEAIQQIEFFINQQQIDECIQPYTILIEIFERKDLSENVLLEQLNTSPILQITNYILSQFQNILFNSQSNIFSFIDCFLESILKNSSILYITLFSPESQLIQIIISILEYFQRITNKTDGNYFVSNFRSIFSLFLALFQKDEFPDCLTESFILSLLSLSDQFPNEVLIFISILSQKSKYLSFSLLFQFFDIFSQIIEIDLVSPQNLHQYRSNLLLVAIFSILSYQSSSIQSDNEIDEIIRRLSSQPISQFLSFELARRSKLSEKDQKLRSKIRGNSFLSYSKDLSTTLNAINVFSAMTYNPKFQPAFHHYYTLPLIQRKQFLSLFQFPEDIVNIEAGKLLYHLFNIYPTFFYYMIGKETENEKKTKNEFERLFFSLFEKGTIEGKIAYSKIIFLLYSEMDQIPENIHKMKNVILTMLELFSSSINEKKDLNIIFSILIDIVKQSQIYSEDVSEFLNECKELISPLLDSIEIPNEVMHLLFPF